MLLPLIRFLYTVEYDRKIMNQLFQREVKMSGTVLPGSLRFYGENGGGFVGVVDGRRQP
jgi:hypothetical protein